MSTASSLSSVSTPFLNHEKKPAYPTPSSLSPSPVKRSSPFVLPSSSKKSKCDDQNTFSDTNDRWAGVDALLDAARISGDTVELSRSLQCTSDTASGSLVDDVVGVLPLPGDIVETPVTNCEMSAIASLTDEAVETSVVSPSSRETDTDSGDTNMAINTETSTVSLLTGDDIEDTCLLYTSPSPRD